jgi:RHS repeat-associated protein
VAGALTTATASWTFPSPFTTQISATTTTTAEAIADQPLPTAAAVGSQTATSNKTGGLVGILVALNPAQTSYAYDQRGNRTTMTPPGGTATTVGYDQARRLTSYSTIATYTYNADNLRMTKTVGATTDTYSYDQNNKILVDATSAATQNYVFGPGGLPLEQISGTGTVTWYHHDQLGSTRTLTNNTGTAIGTATYDPYGNTTATTGTTTPLGYTGSYTDPESGFLYLVNRYYDPGTSQFLTVDPLVAVTQSAYGYVADNPLNGTDPNGLCVSVFGHCLGFHPLQGLKGAVNFAAGAANFVVSTVTLGHVKISVPFCGYGLGTSYDIGEWTGVVEAGLAGARAGGLAGSAESTGRTVPGSLEERLAMQEAQSNPAIGTQLPFEMTDPNWPASQGWVKMAWNNAGVEVHYVWNLITKVAQDFKFKD